MMAFAAKHKVIPDVELIDAKDINHAMAKLSKNANPVNRYVIKIADTLRATADVEGDSSIDPSEWEVLAKVRARSLVFFPRFAIDSRLACHRSSPSRPTFTPQRPARPLWCGTWASAPLWWRPQLAWRFCCASRDSASAT